MRGPGRGSNGPLAPPADRRAARSDVLAWEAVLGRPPLEVPLSTRALVALVLLGTAAAALAGDVPETVDAARIPAYHRVGPALAAAGQPSAEALAALKDLGFRTVVNLRPPAEGPGDEKAVVEGQGLRYVNVPVTADSFRLEDALAVMAVLDDASAGPVLVHCASSNRVGGVLAVIASRRGRSLDEAIAEGRAAGLHSPVMENAVRRVLGAPLLRRRAPRPPLRPLDHETERVGCRPTPQGALMDFVYALLVVAGWVLLQTWVLPRMGVPT